MTTGIIVEYNPMHIGHRKHIESAKKLAPSEPIVAVMSGYFVQRGEPAIVSPQVRAKIAIEAGVDLVLLLPVLHSIQSAQYFAQGAVDQLLVVGVSRIVYGSGMTTESIEALDRLDPAAQRESLSAALAKGTSYAGAHAKSLSQNWLDANTRLGLCYRQALVKRGSRIPAIAIDRAPWEGSDTPLESQNATSIRKQIANGELPLASLQAPIAQPFHSMENYKKELAYLLHIPHIDPLSYPYAEPGLWERLKKMYDPKNSVEEWLFNSRSKRHTIARIRRYLLHVLLDLHLESRNRHLDTPPDALYPLAMNETGKAVLRSLRESEIPVLATTKALHRHIHRNDSIFYWDLKAEALYKLGLE